MPFEIEARLGGRRLWVYRGLDPGIGARGIRVRHVIVSDFDAKNMLKIVDVMTISYLVYTCTAVVADGADP